MLIPCETNFDGQEGVSVDLVPCLMQRVADDQIKPRNKEVPSLHFKFVPSAEVKSGSFQTKGFLPHGLNHRLIAGCCRTNRWKHHAELMFYDYMVFDAEDFCFSLHMTSNGITLSAFDFDKDPNDLCRSLTDTRQVLESLIGKITAQLFPNLICVPYLKCTCVEETLTWFSDRQAK